MELREYQEKAVGDLKKKANELLELGTTKTIVFKAPTGSGKTMMMAEFLKDLVENRDDNKSFSFIWTAPRQLHTQSKEKLERYYFDSRALRCSSFEDLSNKRIGENEILFLNWESINKEDNIYIRDNESDFNLSNITKNTIDEGRIIILVIDESHHTATAENTRGLIQIIMPNLTIEVSATPTTQGDETVMVQREHVIADGMIKKLISLNPGFKNIINNRSNDGVKVKSDAFESTNDFILKIALKKRKELEISFKAQKNEDRNPVNPLILIQLPDRRQGTGDVQDEIVQILKEKHKITTENGKLAIYLSENKENLENITRNDSDVEVMIFKQAIALGWDCPRACILVLFRDWKSFVFSIQTIGRILRMPELKHYDNEEMNTGFVFTNLSDMAIQEDIAGSYVTIYSSKRKNIYKTIALNSVHAKRFREETRLSPAFISDFLSASKVMNLSKKISVDVDEIQAKLISDGIITNPDIAFEHIASKSNLHTAESVELAQTEKEVQGRFDLFIRECLKPLFPEPRSVGRVKDSIYRFLRNNFPTKFEYGGINGQMVVLSPKNSPLFVDVINQAKEIYHKNVRKVRKELIPDENWEIPSLINFDNNYSQRPVKLGIMEPFYELNSASGPEKLFVDFLESKKSEIEWWFKNGVGMGTYFAVLYKENSVDEVFYVDWIVKYKNGKIGLFDTKAGITAQIAKAKAEGLAKYIKEQKLKGKKMFGGIVVYKDGSWRYNDKEKYEYIENDLSEWEFL